MVKPSRIIRGDMPVYATQCVQCSNVLKDAPAFNTLDCLKTIAEKFGDPSLEI